MDQNTEGKRNEEERRNVLTFSNSDISIDVRFDASDQSIWVSAKEIATLFGSSYSNITRHISNIYKDEELDKNSTVAKFAIVQMEGGREVLRQDVEHYNLDVALSVGYRVNAKKAIIFRKWATQTLRAYIEQGYVINEKALRESPEKLNQLAAKVRALRSEEKQVYAKVRECFKLCSSDYNPSSKEVRRFYSLLQDKFHHAITGMTSSKLILDRANHAEESMGVLSMRGDFPTKEEARTGKSYLSGEELYRLHLLSEQFLLFAESTALAKKEMTMSSLHAQLDKLLVLNNYPVFDGYTDYLKEEALKHAAIELGLYKKRKKIESLGIEYSEESLAAGEYDEVLIEFD